MAEEPDKEKNETVSEGGTYSPEDTEIEEKTRINKTRLITNIAVTLAFAIGYSFLNKVFSLETAEGALKVLCDALFVPGGFFLGIGIISFIASDGQFDGLGYSFSKFGKHNLIPGKHDDHPENFYEYRLRKTQKRKSWFREAFIVGLGAVTISIILLVIYENL
ncbi:MAG: DUF3899 domain-containing protein [Lachnospiraceae bacterium]|nr:DUF3899 domain-containing protein [Lachnospiraceae bacterium]